MSHLRAATILGAAVTLAACGPDGNGGQRSIGPYETLAQDLDICATGSTLNGVDVSSYQPGIVWPTVAASGVSFGIAKATEGLTIQDSEFQTNWSGMQSAGVVRGAYHFFHSLDDGSAQADYFLAQVGTFAPGDLPPFLDWESTDTGDTTAHAIASAQNFIDEIQAKTGLTTIIYTYPSFWAGLGNPGQFGVYPLWMASYQTCPDIPAPWTAWLFQQNSATGSTPGIPCSGGCDTDVFNGDLSQLQQVGVDGGGVVTSDAGTLPATVLPQETGNDAVTLVNWPDEHMELFSVTPGGSMQHSATATTGDNWSALATLDTGAVCGSAASFWGGAWLYPELFSPLAAGGTGHLWWTSSAGWNSYQSLGGSGLSHVATTVWPSGQTEVFALGSDGAAWHDYWDTTTTDWSGWISLGGAAFSQGPRPLVWTDGHGELYEVDSSGSVWRSASASGSGTDWTSFAQLGSGIASRLSPVRWPDGTVELFGRGSDGNVWRDTTSAGAFGGFTLLATQQVIGEPSAFMNPGGGAEVVARDPSGNTFDIAYVASSGSWPTSFTSLGETAASDPFAWIRGDGNAEIFAVDGTGNLVHSLRSAGSWSSWGVIGSGADPCAPAIVVVDGGTPLVDAGFDAGQVEDAGQPEDAGNSSDAGEPVDAGQSQTPDAGQTKIDAGEPVADSGTFGPTPTPLASSGCGCSTGDAGAPLLWLFGAVVLLRRRKR
jgi:MYXO-CTERM domain-containing protein